MSDVSTKIRVSLTDEQKIQDKLVNQLMIIWMFLIIFGVSAVLWRAMTFGWVVRDSVHILMAVSFSTLVYFRGRLSLRFKANLIIIYTLLLAFLGFLTLGRSSAAVFAFPLVAMLAAVFYPRKSVVTIALLTIALAAVIAFGIFSGSITLQHDPQALFESKSNWVIYFIGLCFVIAVISSTILVFKQGMEHMMEALEEKHDHLEQALKDIKQLSGLLPICSSCKKIRDDKGYWNNIEGYIRTHSDVDFSHGICPDCIKKLYPDIADEVNEKVSKQD